jgi:glycosyltransferase involved in cell wall biosynthesis
VHHIGIEVGDLLRPHRAGMARYTQWLIEGLVPQAPAAQFSGWAPWRRLLGRFLYPGEIPVRFFGSSSPSAPPAIFHATACVFPDWKSPVEISTVHDLYSLPPLRTMSSELRRRIEYIERADRIICVSRYTRNHLHELLEVPASRTVAIPLAAAPGFTPATAKQMNKLRARISLPNEFFLFVGRDRPNKNLDGLVTAYARSGLSIPLCIAGSQSSKSKERLAALAHTANKGSVQWLGPVPDAELPALLSCASALCMPSTFEGFGLPVIEAMACGTPVLTSAGCATEEAAGGHATLIDPNSTDSMIEGLTLVLQTSEAQRAAARAYATKRSWSDVAAETYQVYVETAREKGIKN